MLRFIPLLAVALCLAMIAAARAERRVALVVGNGAYKQAAPLANPSNDARAVSAALERLGFEVVAGIDLGANELRDTIRRFADKLPGADVALFFYAGHGLQVAGENYLIPTDARIRSEVDLDFNSVRMDFVLRQMERGPGVRIVILDACRENPFEKELARSMGTTRSASLKRGLAEIGGAGGTIIAFATDPGSVALDGTDRHSPFTAALLKHLEAPGIEIGLMLRRVTQDVYKATGTRQRPWMNASLTGEFYLKPGTAVPPQSAPPTEPAPQPKAAGNPAPAGGGDQIELALWQAAESSRDRADYEEYLRQYPNGRFARIARNRIAASGGAPPAGGGASAAAGATDIRARLRPDSFKAAATEIAYGLNHAFIPNAVIRLTLVNQSGVGVGIGILTENASAGPCTGRVHQASGVSLVYNGSLSAGIRLDELEHEPPKRASLAWLAAGARVSVGITIYCDAGGLQGATSADLSLSLLIAAQDVLVTLPLSVDGIRVRQVPNR